MWIAASRAAGHSLHRRRRKETERTCATPYGCSQDGYRAKILDAQESASEAKIAPPQPSNLAHIFPGSPLAANVGQIVNLRPIGNRPSS